MLKGIIVILFNLICGFLLYYNMVLSQILYHFNQLIGLIWRRTLKLHGLPLTFM